MLRTIAVVLLSLNASAALAPAPAPAPVDLEALKIQVFLDRAHVSPGQIDAQRGDVFRLMLSVFQTQHGLQATGTPDDATMQALSPGQESVPSVVEYTLTAADLHGPYSTIPRGMRAQAKLPALNYQSAWDEIGEKFHSSPALLRRMNPQVKDLQPDVRLFVPNVHTDPPSNAVSVSVSKSARVVQLLDSEGKPVASYPATIGSIHDPLPIGNWKVTSVDWNPRFHYNPKLFWDAKASDTRETIQPGPRNPVGVVWIGLDKEHYGLHGTPSPATIGHTESHGCVRLTNWDAAEVGHVVTRETPVIFRE